jgi:hypothetical protein
MKLVKDALGDGSTLWKNGIETYEEISKGYEEIISCPFEAFSNASFAFSLSFLNLYAIALKEKLTSAMRTIPNKILLMNQKKAIKLPTSLLIQRGRSIPIGIPPRKTQFCSTKKSILKIVQQNTVHTGGATARPAEAATLPCCRIIFELPSS